MFKSFKIPLVASQPLVVEFHQPETVLDPNNPKMTSTNVIISSFDVTSKEFVKDIPSQEEFSLQNLLATGVPLSVVNTASMLNSSDTVMYNELASIINNEIVESQKPTEE